MSNTTVQALKAHLALNVHNVERSIEFYKKLLGLEPAKVRTGYAKFDVQNPPLNLTLNQHQFGERGAARQSRAWHDKIAGASSPSRRS